ncbi:MAG: hypothetical protein HOO00_05795 [Rhodospirillaceae bacterium]|jgi:hypothetical protein|nr:hypothetical protein [Rhodospirillaceae bacterium]MBT5373607.1 hypothetical protein [Rhodospirillaceae bacterium]MBT5659624.1 hypothetical protein [Rhodospirillaceae bacterium]MBT5751788.1 hypothetical protein [Rhodospirillaceae bacterium]
MTSFLPRRQHGTIYALLLGLLLISACAKEPPPTGALADIPDPLPKAPAESETEPTLDPSLLALNDWRMVALLQAGPEGLVGLVGEDLTGLLGKPGLIRRDAPAEVWTYQGPICHLDLYLYSDEEWHKSLRAKRQRLKGGVLEPNHRVVYYAIRSKSDGAAISGQACLSSLIDSRIPAGA